MFFEHNGISLSPQLSCRGSATGSVRTIVNARVTEVERITGALARLNCRDHGIRPAGLQRLALTSAGGKREAGGERRKGVEP